MTETIIEVKQAFAEEAWVSSADYQKRYQQSVEDPESFWGEAAATLLWQKKWQRVKDARFIGDVPIRWFAGGMLNVSENCLDRHLKLRGDKTAIIWEADDPETAPRHITYRALHADVCRFANLLLANGVVKSDRVTIYMPMIPEAAIAMLACARIGAVHSVVFGGFSPHALAGRIQDCGSRCVITADEGRRGGKTVPLKANLDAALATCPEVNTTIIFRHTGAKIEWIERRDVDWQKVWEPLPHDCPAAPMQAEDPLFILYTSGSTGKPKGILHTSAGYLLYAALTHQYVFDCKEQDIYWCTADIGWVTGHSYLLYGPLANGATTLMFEGVPNYPDASRFWQVIDRHHVSLFYTAPTALRALMREGNKWVTRTSRKSLRLLASVGEPINPEAWLWYYNVIGETRCPVIDTWWQTETGGIMIAPLPGATALKPGSATLPFFGVRPAIFSEDGQEIKGEGEGLLCIAESWPGQARDIYNDHTRFVETYFTRIPGYYFTGDGCRRDAEGYHWITGRVDDVLNVSGHRLGTAEIESALVAHRDVVEAAVVGYPHAIKGQGIYAFVTLRQGVTRDAALAQNLKLWVRKEIGAIATPDFLQFTTDLPKTRSGKIMRRILRKIAGDDYAELGDISTLLDPAIVERLIAERLNR